MSLNEFTNLIKRTSKGEGKEIREFHVAED